MTAEIVIMNRKAIIMAADSVVTVENKKTHKGVDKLFMLSNYPAMGIMIYGSADFLNIPLETIIKEFKRETNIEELGNIENIKNSFIDFVSDFIPNYLYDDFIHENIIEFEDMLVEKFLNMSEDDFLKEYVDEEILECFKEDTINFNKLIQDFNQKGLDLSIDFLKKAFSSYIKSFSSGVVIAGFNKSDPFPSIIAFNLIIHYKDKTIFEDSLSYLNYSGNIILPFAQTDVITTFLSGVDEYFEFTMSLYFENIFNSYLNDLKKRLILNNKIKDDDLNIVLKEIDVINNLGKYGVNDFQNRLFELKKLNLVPIIESIGSLPKEELAYMAESLINITSLKRKIAADLETVGGNIDVAIISKGDGFIWQKFKPYYNIELNSYFSKC